MEAHNLIKTNVAKVLDKLPCLKTYILDESFNHKIYTISAMARRGGRFMADWMLLLESGQNFNATENEIFEVEFETPISLQWSSNSDDAQNRFKIKSRVILNKFATQMRMLIRPLVMSEMSTLKCDVKVLDQICECAPKVNIGEEKFVFDKNEKENKVVET